MKVHIHMEKGKILISESCLKWQYADLCVKIYVYATWEKHGLGQDTLGI